MNQNPLTDLDSLRKLNNYDCLFRKHLKRVDIFENDILFNENLCNIYFSKLVFLNNNRNCELNASILVRFQEYH